MRRKPIGVLAAIVIVVCLISIARTQCSRATPPRPEDEGQFLIELGALAFFVCENCGAESTGTARPTPFQCEKCRKEAMVESARYECSACGNKFEAFRRRSVMSSDGKRPVAFEVKLHGAKSWRRMKQPPVKCPKCGNDDRTRLRPIAPPPPAPPKAPTPDPELGEP